MPDYNYRYKKTKFYTPDVQYSCIVCKIIFPNKIEYEKHLAKKVCASPTESQELPAPSVIPEVLTFTVGKHVFNNKYEYEKFIGEFDPQELKERRNGITDDKLVGKTLGGNRKRVHIIRGTGESVKQPELPVELYNRVKATEERIVTTPNPNTGLTPVSFYKMAEDVLGKDYSLSGMKVGQKVVYQGMSVPIVAVWDNGTYFIDVGGKHIRQQSTYAMYNNLSKAEMDDVVRRYNQKHSIVSYKQKNDIHANNIQRHSVQNNNPSNFTFGRTTYTSKSKYNNI